MMRMGGQPVFVRYVCPFLHQFDRIMSNSGNGAFVLGRQRWHKIVGRIAAAALATALIASLFLPFGAYRSSAAGAVSITRVFQPSSADNYLDQNNSTTNYGTATTMIVDPRSTGGGRVKRSLVQFTLPPTGSTVTSATLGLYLVTAPNPSRTHNAHRVTSSWTESGSTWNSRNGTNNWTTAGGDFNATATASATTGTTSGVWLSWTVTSDLTGGNWASNGWLVKDSSESGGTNAGTYATLQNGTLGNRPKLTITFTAPWDSYGDTGYVSALDTFDNTQQTVYMHGTGFTNTTYNVGYYDGTVSSGGNLIYTDSNINVTTGDLNSQYLLTTNKNAEDGTWHALVQPTSATSFPSTYNLAVGSPDTYQLLANDSFTVQASAIPELPTVLASIAVAGFCLGIYYYLRKRQSASVEV